MKKINDTYFALTGSPVFAGSFEISDPVARSVVQECIGEGGVHVSAKPFDDTAIANVNAAFGNVYAANPDGYAIVVSTEEIILYYESENGLRYATCALAAHYSQGIPSGILYNVPLCDFRAIKAYIPAREHIGFFKDVIHMMMKYGYNKLVLEIGGAMEYKRHPEINEGWVEYCEIFKEYNNKTTDIQNSQPWSKNSIHCENGGGGFLTQGEMRELALYCASRGIEIVPEVPCLSHSDYILYRHHELSENIHDPLSDTYCPSEPKVYELLFDLFDEIIEVFSPKLIHIGHDEWYTMCVCDKCKDKEPSDLYAADITKIHDYLAARGIETMIWGDKLLPAVDSDGHPHGGSYCRIRRTASGKTVTALGKEYHVYDLGWPDDGKGGVFFDVPEMYQCIELMPKTLKIMNWYHTVYPQSDEVFHKHGLWSVFGNFDIGRGFSDWHGRIAAGVHGATISNWSLFDPRHMQRNGILFGIAYVSMMMWNNEFNPDTPKQNTLDAAHDLFCYANKNALLGKYIEIIHGAKIKIPHKQFVDGNYMVDDDDRLGWYKITYTDGTMHRVPILWGYNIGYMYPDEKDWETNDPFAVEPTYTCDYVIDGDIFYKMVIPVVKDVTDVQLEEEVKDSVEFKSYHLKGQ